MRGNLLLSLCLPTNGMVEYVIPTLESIYSDAEDLSLFEVIVTDNAPHQRLEKAIQQFTSKYDNLLYVRTNAEGFLNQICAFELGKGRLLKFHNHRAIMLPGTLKQLLNSVIENQGEKPLMFFSNGVLKKFSIATYLMFDTFVRSLSYWSTWSSGLALWKEDFDQMRNMECHPMFPHATLLFFKIDKTKYIIDNRTFLEMQDDSGKGGYNVYKTFAVEYLDLVYSLVKVNRISLSTFKYIKSDLYYHFLIPNYFKLVICRNSYSFDLTDIKIYMLKYYSSKAYWWMLFWAYYYYPLRRWGGGVIRCVFCLK